MILHFSRRIPEKDCIIHLGPDATVSLISTKAAEDGMMNTLQI